MENSNLNFILCEVKKIIYTYNIPTHDVIEKDILRIIIINFMEFIKLRWRLGYDLAEQRQNKNFYSKM